MHTYDFEALSYRTALWMSLDNLFSMTFRSRYFFCAPFCDQEILMVYRKSYVFFVIFNISFIFLTFWDVYRQPFLGGGFLWPLLMRRSKNVPEKKKRFSDA